MSLLYGLLFCQIVVSVMSTSGQVSISIPHGQIWDKWKIPSVLLYFLCAAADLCQYNSTVQYSALQYSTVQYLMWMWSRFQNQSQARLQAAAASSGLDPAPEVILWSNHLTSEQYIHYLDPDTYTIQVR